MKKVMLDRGRFVVFAHMPERHEGSPLGIMPWRCSSGV